jgi:hypothetical protein
MLALESRRTDTCAEEPQVIQILSGPLLLVHTEAAEEKDTSTNLDHRWRTPPRRALP